MLRVHSPGHAAATGDLGDLNGVGKWRRGKWLLRGQCAGTEVERVGGWCRRRGVVVVVIVIVDVVVQALG